MRGILDSLNVAKDWKLFPILNLEQRGDGPRNATASATTASTDALTTSHLGRQLTDALQRVQQLEPYSTIVFLGMDAPELPLDEIREAIRVAQTRTALLCPADDGGYGLLSVPRSSSETMNSIFQSVRWSNSLTAVSQLKALTDTGMQIKVGRLMHDIDEPDDVVRLCQRLKSQPSTQEQHGTQESNNSNTTTEKLCVSKDDCLLRSSGDEEEIETGACRQTRIALSDLGHLK